MNARRLGAILSILSALAPLPLHAADPDDAAALVLRGVDRFRHEDYEGARAAFARAYDLAPSARTLFNLALAELQSGHALESLRHMRAYLTQLEAEPDKVEAIRSKWRARAEAQTCRVQVDAPAGANIDVDGRAAGRAPLEAIDVSVGEHELTAREGVWSWSEHIVARPGALVSLRFEAPTQWRRPVAPATPLPTPAGTSILATPRFLATLSLASGAVVATGVGIAFALVSQNEAKIARDLMSQIPVDKDHPGPPCGQTPLPSQCPRLQANNRAAQSAYYLSNGFYVGAGVLAGAAALTWILWPARASTPTRAAPPTLTPTADLDRAGLALSGTW